MATQPSLSGSNKGVRVFYLMFAVIALPSGDYRLARTLHSLIKYLVNVLDQVELFA